MWRLGRILCSVRERPGLYLNPLCIINKPPSTLLVSSNFLLLSFERKYERRVLLAEIQEEKKAVSEGEINRCPIRALTSRMQRSHTGGEWIFLII